MPQRYKLRLGDGTVMAVDSHGLRAWAGDRAATVQVIGSWRWQPLHEVLAEEEAAARLAQALVPPTPKPAPPDASVGTPPAPSPQPTNDPFNPLADLPTPSYEPPIDEAFRPAPARPTLQALADDPSASGPGIGLASGEDLPIIPMKPVDDAPAFRSAWEEDEGIPEEEAEAPRHDRLEGPLLTVLQALGGLLSRILTPLTPLARRLGARRERAAPPAPSVEASRPSVVARASAWLRGLGRRSAPAEDGESRRASAAALSPTVPLTRAPKPPVARPREKVPPPTPIAELPTLRFVESKERRAREDVYAEEPGEPFSLGPVWQWTKRLVVIGALAGGVAWAVIERETWFPRAAALGQTFFNELDRRVLSRQRHQEQQQALATAAERLPALGPDTIQLFFSRSPTGVLEAPEVFQLAREAADRGRATLTRAEAEELASLEGELLGGLSRTERARVREYDRTRARRPIFPFENPHVMDLVARGARALPDAERARLQELTHKAVLAAIDLPASPQPSTAAERAR